MTPIGALINEYLSKGQRPFYSKVISNAIPNRDKWKFFHAVEDVLIVGYPDRIMDFYDFHI